MGQGVVLDDAPHVQIGQWVARKSPKSYPDLQEANINKAGRDMSHTVRNVCCHAGCLRLRTKRWRRGNKPRRAHFHSPARFGFPAKRA